jgi:predicted transcriptional regulator of viral defense system
LGVAEIVIRQLGDIPGAQFGYFTRAQAAAMGVEDFSLTRSVERGYIQRLGHGVYRVAGAGDDPLQDLRVAWLKLEPARSPRQRLLQPDIWVSHESAAIVHGFGDFIADQHSFISTRRIQPRSGVRMYRRQKLDRDEWTTRDGLAITNVGRTAADLLAAGADGGHVGRFLADAFSHGAATVEQVSRSTKSTHDEIKALVAQSFKATLS